MMVLSPMRSKVSTITSFKDDIAFPGPAVMVKTGDHCVGCGNKARAKHGCEEFLPFFRLQ